MQDSRKSDEIISDSENESEALHGENKSNGQNASASDIAENHNADSSVADNAEEKEELQSSDRSDETEPFEENQFIIPDSVEFFITESESENVSSENELLDVEHFRDYKSAQESSIQEDEATENDGLENSEQAAYESLTLLDEEKEEKVEPAPAREKYVNPDGKEYDSKNPRKVDGRFDFLELFVFTLVAVMIITTFIFRHSVVEGPSMQNTLQNGEHLIISNLFYTPKRGDIIVCQDYETGHRNPIVKRIIATEGDTIEILPDGSVFVNGQILNEDYVFIDPGEIDDFPGMPKTTVPEDMVFVMGDHRNKSSDSREFLSTFVREDAILGKVILRFYPFDKFGTVD